jgi:hypothetical protein
MLARTLMDEGVAPCGGARLGGLRGERAVLAAGVGIHIRMVVVYHTGLTYSALAGQKELSSFVSGSKRVIHEHMAVGGQLASHFNLSPTLLCTGAWQAWEGRCTRIGIITHLAAVLFPVHKVIHPPIHPQERLHALQSTS